jgi:hypothetical protein
MSKWGWDRHGNDIDLINNPPTYCLADNCYRPFSERCDKVKKYEGNASPQTVYDMLPCNPDKDRPHLSREECQYCPKPGCFRPFAQRCSNSAYSHPLKIEVPEGFICCPDKDRPWLSSYDIEKEKLRKTNKEEWASGLCQQS